MRKIAARLFVSLDGVVEAPETWVPPYAGDEFTETMLASMAESDALLVGRRTYEVFAASWPERGTEEPMAAYMNTVPKFVASTTLDRADWNNSTVLNGDIGKEITALKQQTGKNINVAGSATLVEWLLRQQLLDELSLLIFPVIVGKGQRLFTDGGDKVPLRLLESRSFTTGVQSAAYAPAPADG
ncbi:dihydrofolate reductase [Kribbella pittospori]|uniref:Dihydrofolate reductase n=1 Tax=Kribbella pittospori TaxID=722689 RepID=A0A4R0JF38_9ACTN|nr:dihydrofolate reductase family protein [Kribbella pittospori]TCC45431.1 dihydrofolate reductase [Kribbella pittospori]